jgi:predicted dehydrogenase
MKLTRKRFLATAAAAPAFLKTLSASDEIHIGHIGVGVRGGTLVKNAVASEGAKVTAICDVYKPHVEKGVEYALNPQAKRYVDYQELLANDEIDAVVIATPDHWHSKMLIDAVEAGKDVYIEKGWTRTVAEAKAMRAAVKNTGRIMQLGHQGRQWAAAIEARKLVEDDFIGPISLVRTGRAMNRPEGTPIWRWYGWYTEYERPAQSEVVKDLDWARWLGPLDKEPFNMEHFWHWRCYWPYGTGIYGDLLSHELDYVQTVLRHGIPDTCFSAGHNNLLKDGRTVPDTVNTIYQWEAVNRTATFFSDMNSGYPQTPELRGKYAAIVFNKIGQAADSFEVIGDKGAGRYDAGVIRKFDPAKNPKEPTHMQDFINAVRERRNPKCDVDEAFIEAVTLIMAFESHQQQRTVRWNRSREEIV